MSNVQYSVQVCAVPITYVLVMCSIVRRTYVRTVCACVRMYVHTRDALACT